MSHSSIAERDRQVVWHPYTYIKDFPGALGIEKTEGEFLLTQDGRRLIDAISSWWVNVHGHSHPYLIESLKNNAAAYDQMIFADLTHEAAVRLAERVLKKFPAPHLSKVFFSDNGSTAVEVALKLAIQAAQLKNPNQKKKTILALEGSYHGDTFGAMAASSRGLFTHPYNEYLFDVQFIPIHSGDAMAYIEQILSERSVVALIYEPLLQGAGGMLVQDKSLTERILARLKTAGSCLIADEVLTGFGRTGTMFASEQMSIKPDLVCLSKGLTGGVLPLGLTLIADSIYQLFSKVDFKDSFFHGHSYTANPWACHVANASLDLFEQEGTWSHVKRVSDFFKSLAQDLAFFPMAKNIRCLGPLLAFDLMPDQNKQASYAHPLKKTIMSYFLDKGIYLRPLGNTIYFMPPYCTRDESLQILKDAVMSFLKEQPWNP